MVVVVRPEQRHVSPRLADDVRGERVPYEGAPEQVACRRRADRRVHEPVVGDVVVVADHVGGHVGEQATNLRHLASELVEDGLGAEELEPGLFERPLAGLVVP